MDDEVIHPHYGELEAYRRGEADAAMAEHVPQCSECQSALEELAGIAAMLRQEEAELPPIPEHINQKMHWHAQQHAARVRRELRRARLQRWAIAASVLLSIGALVAYRRMSNVAVPRFDVVDALVLARKIEAGHSADSRYDINHDGRVDAADIERIARQTVVLGDA
jgi:predicted anti-sigma-YlaC factor YlaD